MSEKGKNPLKEAAERIAAQQETTQRLMDELAELGLPQALPEDLPKPSRNFTLTGPLHFSEELIEKVSQDS